MTQRGDERGATDWTFAELANTYRFWALIAGVVFAILGLSLSREYLFYAGLSPHRRSSTMMVISGSYWGLGSIFGVPLGLLLARCKTTAGLLGVLLASTALGVAMLLVDVAGWPGTFIRWFHQAVMVALFIAVPALLAGWAKNRVAVANALLIVLSWQILFEVVGGLTMATIGWFDTTLRIVGLSVLLAFIAACLALYSIRGRDFEYRPDTRHAPLTPRRRGGLRVMLATALPWVAVSGLLLLFWFPNLASRAWMRGWAITALAIIPGGMLVIAHWLYRIHGEAASMTTSPQLLSPKAALLTYVFVPASIPVLLLGLGDVLRELESRRAGLPRRSAGWFVAWSLLFPPVAMGIAQSRLNMVGRPVDASPA